MTKLTRLTAKIFGETATATGDDPEIGQFGSALAGTYVGTTDVATIQSLPAWSNGFIDSVTPLTQFPPLPEMTGFGKVLSYQTAYTLQQGMPEWDSATTYYINNFCAYQGIIYKSITDSNLNNVPLNDTVNWEVYGANSARNIGEIVSSTLPLTDAGLHLLDGALLQGSGVYGAFVNYIADLVTDYPNLFLSEADWQAAVTANGACGKFVYDSVNNTVRLPKITGFIEGTTDLTALGDLVEAGLPNILGSFSTDADITANGCCYTTGHSGSGFVNDTNGTWVVFDASRSSSIYGNSSTVQPQTIKVLYYIVIATSTKTDIEVDIDEIATDLNGKADVDLTNTLGSWSSSSKDYVVTLAHELDWNNAILVDSNYTPSQISIPYTMPDDGVLLVYVKSEGGSSVKTVNAIIYFTSDLNGPQVSSSMYTSDGAYAGVYFPFLKDTIVYYHFNITGTATTRVGRCYFVPFKKS